MAACGVNMIKWVFKNTIRKLMDLNWPMILYFLLNCLFQIEHKGWDYCFCADYTNDRLCELCLIQGDFNTFEEVITKIVLDRQFLIADQQKLYPPLRRLFLKKYLQYAVSLILFTLLQFAEEMTNLELFMSKKWLIKWSIGNSRSKRINFTKWMTLICCFDKFFLFINL